MSGGMGTPLFSAPELLLGGWRYDQSVDVVARLASSLPPVRVLARAVPARARSDQGFLARVAAGAVRPDLPGVRFVAAALVK